MSIKQNRTETSARQYRISAAEKQKKETNAIMVIEFVGKNVLRSAAVEGRQSTVGGKQIATNRQ